LRALEKGKRFAKGFRYETASGGIKELQYKGT
jgi:hypothetical protein